jgi:hypothetical protein
MAGTLKKLRFIRPWQNYRVGQEITPNGTMRDWLIGNGYCEVIVDKPTISSQSVNRMVNAPNRRHVSQR